MNDSFGSDNLRGLERALRDEAADLRRTPRPSVAEEVMDALPERPGRAASASDARGTSPVRAVAGGPRPSLVAGRLAAAAAIAAGLYGLWTWDTVEHAPRQRPAAHELASAPRTGLDRLQDLGNVDVTLTNPLLEEARRLGRDATNATGFLATRLPPAFRSALFSRL